MWGLLEITLGANKNIKPKVRNLDIGEPFKIQLAGSTLAVMTKNGVNRVGDVYSGKQVPLDHEYSMQKVSTNISGAE